MGKLIIYLYNNKGEQLRIARGRKLDMKGSSQESMLL